MNQYAKEAEHHAQRAAACLEAASTGEMSLARQTVLIAAGAAHAAIAQVWATMLVAAA